MEKGKLIELVNDIILYLPWGEIASDTAERIADRIIENGITVQKRGHWEEAPDEYGICATEFTCSNCKESLRSSEMTDEEFLMLMKYCPNCGAQMDTKKLAMFECEWCGDPDCCERLDLRSEPVLCDECYFSAKEFEEERSKEQ